MVGKLIVNQGKVVRPSQLIASVRRARGREGKGCPGLTGGRLRCLLWDVGPRGVVTS
jgi:hypothetical protein